MSNASTNTSREQSRSRPLEVSPGPGVSPGVSPIRGNVTPEHWRQARAWVCNVRNPWEPCILALDGGGIRGFSSALILKELMHQIYLQEHEMELDDPTGDIPASEDDLLPCHYFDFMYGTSTGGLIAVMLARLRMSIGDCLSQYRVVGDRLFGHRRTIIPFMTKYKSEPLVKAVKELVDSKNLGTLHPWDAITGQDRPLVPGSESVTQREAQGGRSSAATRGASGAPTSTAIREAPSPRPEGAPSTAIREAPSSRPEGAPSTAIREAPSTAIREAPSTAIREAPSTAIREAPSTAIREAPSSRSQGASTHQNGGAKHSTTSGPIFADGFTTEPSPVERAFGKRNDSLLAGPAQWDDPSQPYWDPDEPRVCQSCCLTAIHNGSVQKAHLLRSYPHYYHPSRMQSFTTSYNPGADPLEIWQVTRATSAAPFYFDMLEAEVDGEIRGHKDGGIRENNPAVAAWDEFSSLYYPKTAPALLLSIGTGRTNTPPDGFMSALPWPWGHFRLFRKIAENISVIPNLLVKYTESEGKHEQMLQYAKGENTWYKRLNVSKGMDNMSLDSWIKGPYHDEVVPGGSSLARMEDATNAYLSRDVDRQFETFTSPKDMIKHSAEKLVRVRRARRKLGGPRWEYYMGEGLRERMAAQTNTGGSLAT